MNRSNAGPSYGGKFSTFPPYAACQRTADVRKARSSLACNVPFGIVLPALGNLPVGQCCSCGPELPHMPPISPSASIPTSPSVPISSMPRRAYKIHEVAEILGIKPITVRRLIDRGLIRPCRALRHVLVDSDEINRFLKN